MDNRKESPRLNRITNELADSVENSITKAGKNIISVFISEAESWLLNTYERWKRSLSLQPKYEELQKYIEVSSENIQIGMDKKEIAIKVGARIKNARKVKDSAREHTRCGM